MLRGFIKNLNKSLTFSNQHVNILNINKRLEYSSRFYSSQSSNSDEKPKLKNILKQFYLKVHPDTIVGYPKEKSVNAMNMKLFMSVFDQYKKRPFPDANAKPTIHNLSFYVPQNVEEKEGDFKLVEIELIQNSMNPNHVPTQLSKLFAMCDLPSDFITEIDQVDNVKQPDLESTLKDFLLDNKKYVKQVLYESANQKAELDQLIKKVKRELDLNIQLTTTPSESNFTYKENYFALHQVIEDLSKWKEGLKEKVATVSDIKAREEILKNIKFNLNHSEINYTSPDPVVYLDRSSPETWPGYLNRIKFPELLEEVKNEKAEAIKRHTKFNNEKKEFEKHFTELEKLLKVRSIRWVDHDDPREEHNHYMEQHDQMTQCLEFTKMLIKNKQQLQQSLKSGKLKDLKMRVNIGICPNLKSKVSHIDMDGTLKVSPLVGFDQFIQILADNYQSSMETAKLLEKYEAIRDYAQVRLGLRELTCLNMFVHEHGFEKVYQAYQKLYDSADRIRDIGLSGFTIIIGDYYSISKQGDIFLKYDFSVDDIIRQLTAPEKENDATIDEEQQHQIQN
ncbi:hypothetical protein DLAC_09142 [Tieghemostelium lacteum]|uniref:DUF4460 domain-containing protein n=1 Tax=Tieghemostelium lacteum TaxID=361077 RepID=A0A151Z9A8_TIELA|nr:hypothetical protein DLAC_09142 [Tieghemostelium lacteum]|eukprot:KYQ90517.1 hypothetical protein DLAC_09142 [Tieghemostelium lacteum]